MGTSIADRTAEATHITDAWIRHQDELDSEGPDGCPVYAHIEFADGGFVGNWFAHSLAADAWLRAWPAGTSVYVSHGQRDRSEVPRAKPAERIDDTAQGTPVADTVAQLIGKLDAAENAMRTGDGDKWSLMAEARDALYAMVSEHARTEAIWTSTLFALGRYHAAMAVFDSVRHDLPIGNKAREAAFEEQRQAERHVRTCASRIARGLWAENDENWEG